MALKTLNTLPLVATALVMGGCAYFSPAPVAKVEPAPARVAKVEPVKPAPAPVAVAPVAAASSLKLMPLPAGFLAIHYHRPAKDWAPVEFAKCDFIQCWGVHVWGDAYSSDTGWVKPLFPVGTDEFGAVYHIKANEDKDIAATAEANYIIHKGDTKDQCGKDMSWDHNKSKEIFVVQDDCKVYLSLDAAMKSSKYK